MTYILFLKFAWYCISCAVFFTMGCAWQALGDD